MLKEKEDWREKEGVYVVCSGMLQILKHAHRIVARPEGNRIMA